MTDSPLGRFDTGNAQFGETLAMAIGAPVILAPLFLKDGDGPGSILVDDLGFDGGTFDQRLSDHHTLFAMNQPNLADFDCPPHLAGKGLHLD
jgi:hypothetical protein